MAPTDDRLREVFDLVERHIEDRYRVPVVVSDVPNPFTGDLDGAEIRVDYALTVEEALFVLVHLFGHTVQWNLSQSAREIGSVIPAHPTDAEIVEIERYEREACCYSLQLFWELGVRDLDQWLADFAACDAAYLVHFYRTGEKLPFRGFWHDGCPALEPLPIPRFEPTRWRSRWAGTVV